VRRIRAAPPNREKVWSDSYPGPVDVPLPEEHPVAVSEFQVAPEALSTHAARLSRFSYDIDDVRGRMAGGAGAAASTPAAGALEHLSGHLNGRLADFGAAADALHRAMLAAGAHYAAADRTVEESAS
jgi:hypothetical protein